MEQKYSLLIVDDNPINIKVLMDSLNKPDYKLLSATNGQKALMIAENVLPDLILLDINMPGINGYETCEKLKENEKTKDIPVIFLSALNEVGNKVHGFNVGGVDYITKPFQREEILVRVKTQLQIAELHNKTREQKEDISSILHILSHDILNQIMLIDISTTLLKSEVQSSEEGEKRFDMIHTTVKNISDLITRVRSITRLDEGKYKLELQPFHPKELKVEIDSVFQHRFKEKHISIEYDFDDSLDKDSFNLDSVIFLNTVINNIISNAIKFSFKGSKIHIRVYQEDSKKIMEFIDFGVGMTDIQLDNIFKTDTNTTTKGTEGERGTGYGMPLVKRYTEAMGGKLELTSKHIDDDSENHGTSIKLIFS